MQWFYNLKVAQKLAVLVLLTLVCFVFTGVMAFNSLNRINANVDIMYHWMLIPITEIENAVSSYLELGNLIMQLKTGPSAASTPNLQEQARKHIAVIQSVVNKYLSDYALYKDPDSVSLLTAAGKADLLTSERDAVQWLADNLNSLQQAADNLFKTLDLSAWEKNGETTLKEGRNKLGQLVSINLEAAALVDEHSDSEYMQSRNVLVIGIVTAAAVSIAIASVITRSIIKPLTEIDQLAVSISNGDLTAKAVVKNKDELGEMAGALNQAVDRLRETVKGVLTLSDSVLRASQELSASAEEVSASIEEVASTSNEFAATVEAMNKNAQQVSESANGIANPAAASRSDMGTAVNRIDDLRSIMAELANSMHELHSKSQEIGNIVSLITDVANQTNLLALNAAIEAARAGEHGRGFAVVAEEVRKLAEQTASATANITSLVAQIQHQTQTVMTSSDTGAAEADESFDLIRESWRKLDDILQAISSIAKETEQLAAGTEQIGSGSEEIAATTEEQSASIQLVAAAAQNLSQIAEQLQRNVAFFHVS